MDSYRKGRLHLAFSALSMVVIILLAGTATFGLANEDLVGVTESGTLDIGLDGLYVVIEDEIEISNDFRSDFKDLDVWVSLYDTKYNNTMRLWEDHGITVPAGGSVTLPVSIRCSLFSFSAALIDSIKTEGSVLKLRVETSASYVYGLFNADIGFDLSCPLSDEGKTVSYGTVTNTMHQYSLEIRNLSQRFMPPTAEIILESADCSMIITVEQDTDLITYTMYSDGDLEDVIEKLKGQEVTATINGDSWITGTGDLLSLATAIIALRFVL